MSTAKGKVTRVVNQLKISVPEFTKLAVDDADRELDKAALEVSNQWNRLENWRTVQYC